MALNYLILADFSRIPLFLRTADPFQYWQLFVQISRSMKLLTFP